jgi:hypothetical protein
LSLNEDRGSRDGLENHLRDDASTVAASLIEGRFDGSGRGGLSVRSVKDASDGEERGEEIHSCVLIVMQLCARVELGDGGRLYAVWLLRFKFSLSLYARKWLRLGLV